MTGEVTRGFRLKTVAVSPEIHAQLKELQQTKHGEVTMDWVIAELLQRNEGRMIHSVVEKREKQE